MINLTSNIIFLKHGKELDDELTKALNKIYKAEVKYCKRFCGVDRKRSYQEKQFSERCNSKDIKEKISSERLINTAMNAVQADKLLGTKTAPARVNQFLSLFDNEGVQVNYLPSIRRPIARLLIELRSSKCILLPMYFPALNYIPYFDGRYSSIKGMNVYNHFKIEYEKIKSEGKTGTQLSAIISFILATDWNNTNDIKLNDIAEFHRVYAGYIVLKEANIPKTRISKTYFLNMISKMKGDLSFSQNELDVFKYWLISTTWIERYSFDEYYKNQEDLQNEKKKEYYTKKNIASKKYKVKKVKQIIQNFNNGNKNLREAVNEILNGSGLACTIDAKMFLQRQECADVIYSDSKLNEKFSGANRIFLSMLAKKGEVENYYINLSNFKRTEEWGGVKYPGFEEIDLVSQTQYWESLYKIWIDDRIDEGKESLSVPSRAYKSLMDYIFLYIPLWIKANPKTNVEIPLYPKDFDRFTFVHRDYFDDEGEVLPSTLYEMFELRYGKDSVTTYQLFAAIKQFFIFLQKKRKTLKKYLGENWKSPIEETDKFKSGARNKTSKVAFEEEASPWTLRYFYALNEYGVYLQKLALEGNYFARTQNKSSVQLSKYRMINTENEFEGYVPVLKGRDINGNKRSVRLTEIPNIFTFTKRLVQQVDGTTIEILLPEISSCRVNITMYETGRRNSNARHLCRDTWDELNHGCNDDELFFELNVNTDKTQNEDQIKPAPMLRRLRNILKQEEKYQRMLSLTEQHKEVNYLDRKQTRFKPFVPLFRSTANDKPVSDGVVRKCFGWMLYGLQETLNKNRISDFDYKWVSYNKETNQIILPRETNTHTFRANFISDRFPFFPDDINILTSQSNLHVSGHYYRPSRRDIKNRFIAADNKIHDLRVEGIDKTSATESFDGSVHLHPSSPNSALRKSWEEDREETIRRFHFVMINTLPADLDKESQRGLELLKVSPSNQIKWFDTHACPVNMQCPDNIIHLIGSSHRCGICPIAAKCVDHIPAIRAERRAIGSRIIQANLLINKLRDEGAEASIIRKVQKDKQLDSIEFSGWQAAEKYLTKALNFSEDNSDVWHVQMPEMVKLHLDVVVPPSSGQSYLLERVSAVQAYPSLALKDPTLESRTKMLALKIANDQGLLNKVIDQLDNDLIDPVNLLANSMSIMMKAKGIKPEQLYAKIKNDEEKLLENPAADHMFDDVELQGDK